MQDPQSVSHTGHRGHSQQDSGHVSNQNANQLLAFKKGMKTEVSQYDEKYFEAFKTNLLVTATTHGCEEVLESDYLPRYDDDRQCIIFMAATSGKKPG